MIRILLLSLLIPFIAQQSLAIEDTPELELIQTLGNIEEYRLSSNGLTVLLMHNDGLPVATVMVTYKVGSRNEVTGTTGATHILEHMMFKGTDRFNYEDGSDYSSTMERIGARSNATTWFDRTNYYATLPRQYVPMTIELEADRMRNLRIRDEDLASEMTVVRNEYERGENNPVRTLIKELYATAFMAHPYSHPTIGWRSDIESTSPEKLRTFYDTYYWPENAVLSVIGGFDKAATLDAIVKHYGAVPKAPKSIPQLETTEPEQIGPRRVNIERAGQVGVVLVGFKVPDGRHEDWATLTLIQQILGADKTGRLYRALEDKGKASATFTYAPQLHDPGLYTFGAYLTPDATHEEVEGIILDEIEALINGGVDPEELARAKSVIKASTVYGRDGSYSIADQINEYIAMGDWTAYVNLPEAIENVEADSLQEVAAKYFVKRSQTSGWFVPTKAESATAQSRSLPNGNYFRDPEMTDLVPLPQKENTKKKNGASIPKSVVNFSENMQRAEVAGIEIIAVDMPIEGVVSFVGSLAAGDSLSPDDAPMLASLTAAMLDKGTTKTDRFKIAEKLDTLGANIGFAADAHSLSFAGKFLRPNAGAVVKLLADQLREPAFDADVLDTMKSRQKSGLLQAIDNPDYRAGAAVSQMLYPEGHPNYSTPIETLIEDLESTSAEDLRAFHAAHYGTKSMRLIFVGDIDFEQLTAAVGDAFEGWEGGVDYPQEPNPQLDNKAQSDRIFIADKTSVSLNYGYNTKLRRTDDDYLPFMLGNYILGASFHSRLMTEVRKNRGLTYNIRSSHQGDIMTKGNWSLNASFAPSMFDQGVEATETVINDWYRDGVTEKEVSEAIETLSGSYLVGLSTTGSVAGQLHSFVQRGFAPEYIDEYPNRLRTLNAAKVNKIIKKYFDPTALTQVAAGSLLQSAKDPVPSETKTLSIRLDTPHAGWRVDIDRVYRSKDSIVVIAELSENSAAAAAVISTVSDSIEIGEQELDGVAVRYYVMGKTWAWGDTGEYSFIDSIDDFGTGLEGAKVLYEREK